MHIYVVKNEHNFILRNIRLKKCNQLFSFDYKKKKIIFCSTITKIRRKLPDNANCFTYKPTVLLINIFVVFSLKEEKNNGKINTTNGLIEIYDISKCKTNGHLKEIENTLKSVDAFDFQGEVNFAYDHSEPTFGNTSAAHYTEIDNISRRDDHNIEQRKQNKNLN